MDYILNQATTASFWGQVLFGQVLFIGGLLWLISSVQKDFNRHSMTMQKKNSDQRNNY